MIITPTHETIATAGSDGATFNPLNIFAKEYNMYKGDHYYFSCSPEMDGAVPMLYQNALSLAESTVWVWDSYFHQDDGAIFGALTKAGIKIKIITEPKVPLPTFMDGVVTRMETAMSADVKSDCSVTITQAKGLGYSNWKMHDRFLIIDLTDVYLIGSSVGNYLNLGESTGAYQIMEHNDKELIIKAFNYYWSKLDQNGNVETHVF